MSDLRARVIRLAHEKPELRDDLLPLLTASQDKSAGLAKDMLFSYVDRRGLIEVQRSLRSAGDEQSVKLIRAVQVELLDRMGIDGDVERAINRLAGLAKRGGSWDPSMQRNALFKVADELGMKLPSGIFASEGKTAKHPKIRRLNMYRLGIETAAKYLKGYVHMSDPSDEDTKKAKEMAEAIVKNGQRYRDAL